MKNLTPHAIKILILEDGKERVIVFEPHPDGPARVTEVAQYLKPVQGIPTVRKEYNAIVNFNRKGTEDVIVSAFVAERMRKEFRFSMRGVFTPDTGPDSAIRDKEGRIVAVKRLIRLYSH